jgi:hypothetical protein
MIQLGGNIELEGFEGVEPGKLVVIKKIVGSYTRKISDSTPGFEKITLYLDQGTDTKVSVIVMVGGNETKHEESDKNLFFALDKALLGAQKKLG